MKYIAYIRVSSQKQGRSGLGLEAQKGIIIHNVGKENIVKWYEEVYTGKNLKNLPKLQEAITQAKKDKFVLIIAKTDRLRNTQQALDLVDELTPEGVFFCNVGRNADKFMLTLFFAFAEKERLEISIRTKAALAVLKSRGVKLGRPKAKKPPLCISKLGAAARFLKSVQNPENAAASNVAALLRQQGCSYHKIALFLNEKDYATPNHSTWRAASVMRLLKKYLKFTETLKTGTA